MKRIIFSLYLIWSTNATVCRGDDLTTGMNQATALNTNVPPVNLSAEVARARNEHKLLVLEFGSSDACPPCTVFQKMVFSQPEFQRFESSNLDFIRLDFPFRASLRADTQATNDLLSRQFDVDGFPTFIALDKDGKEFWRMPTIASLKSGNFDLDTNLFEPIHFIALIESIKQQEK
jgi:thioredoxin-related protein